MNAVLRRLRLGSGLVLFVFVLTHFLNHSLGLVSLDLLVTGRSLFLALWRNLPATFLLYGALLLHLGLAYWAIYDRRRLRMPPWEAVQLLLGLAIPPLLVLHILGTRLAFELYGVEDSYLYVLLIFFVFKPLLVVKQFVLVLVAWVHGVIGLHFWLRLRPWYARVQPILFAAALLVPTLAMVGAWVAGRDIARLYADPGWRDAVVPRIKVPDAEGLAMIERAETAILTTLAALLLLTLAARLLRTWWQRRHGIITITYPDRRRVPVPIGTSVLEASLSAGIPHASVCGGRGRCSTCRVRIGTGLEALASASEAERKVLARVGAAPNVRLACQTQPTQSIEVTPLLPPTASPRDAWRRPGHLQGQEREVAILFADLRGFTRLSENKLPYDVVFLLNRYFAAMGGAVEAAGGRVDKFIGDGVMALFGVEGDVGQGCRNALAAARGMAEKLTELNAALKQELESPLRIGIGIHVGAVIVGEMGYGRATSVTAIGDAVNTASRLEALTKEHGAQLILSDPVGVHAGVDLTAFPQRDVEVRGREASLSVRVIVDAKSLP